MSLESWVDLVDLEKLAKWMDAQGLESGGLENVT